MISRAQGRDIFRTEFRQGRYSERSVNIIRDLSSPLDNLQGIQLRIGRRRQVQAQPEKAAESQDQVINVLSTNELDAVSMESKKGIPNWKANLFMLVVKQDATPLSEIISKCKLLRRMYGNSTEDEKSRIEEFLRLLGVTRCFRKGTDEGIPQSSKYVNICKEYWFRGLLSHAFAF